MPYNPAVCQGCESAWTSREYCHCCSCHKTFTDVQSFDLHRNNFKCVRPSSRLFRKGEDGSWTMK